MIVHEPDTRFYNIACQRMVGIVEQTRNHAAQPIAREKQSEVALGGEEGAEATVAHIQK